MKKLKTNVFNTLSNYRNHGMSVTIFFFIFLIAQVIYLFAHKQPLMVQFIILIEMFAFLIVHGTLLFISVFLVVNQAVKNKMNEVDIDEYDEDDKDEENKESE